MTETTTAPTPAEIQNAETRLAAYLEARAADYAIHGWRDDGVIESRAGRTLMTHYIDITLRRARAAERDRDQALAENAALRRALVDAQRHNGTDLLAPGPIVDVMTLAHDGADGGAADA